MKKTTILSNSSLHGKRSLNKAIENALALHFTFIILTLKMP